MPALPDLILARALATDISKIIDRASNQEKLTGATLQESLVISGVHLGASKVEIFAIHKLNLHGTILRKALTMIEQQLALAAGNDEMTDFVLAMRTPMIQAMQEMRDLVLHSLANTRSERSGVEPSLYMLRAPVEELGRDTLREAGEAMTLNQPETMAGFALLSRGKAIEKMPCPCGACMARVFLNSDTSMKDAMALARQQFGSTDDAFVALGAFELGQARKRVVEFEESFGQVDDTADIDMAEAASRNIFDKLLHGSGVIGHDEPGQ